MVAGSPARTSQFSCLLAWRFSLGVSGRNANGGAVHGWRGGITHQFRPISHQYPHQYLLELIVLLTKFGGLPSSPHQSPINVSQPSLLRFAHHRSLSHPPALKRTLPSASPTSQTCLTYTYGFTRTRQTPAQLTAPPCRYSETQPRSNFLLYDAVLPARIPVPGHNHLRAANAAPPHAGSRPCLWSTSSVPADPPLYWARSIRGWTPT